MGTKWRQFELDKLGRWCGECELQVRADDADFAFIRPGEKSDTAASGLWTHSGNITPVERHTIVNPDCSKFHRIQ